MPLAAGTKLGPYEIVSPLGAGGMGEVYRARDTRLARTVALKILPTELSEHAEAKQRFEREARAISSLNHPHICTLHDVGHQGGIDYLVMEYLEGMTLAARIARGPLPLDEVVKYGVEICEGLEKAHRNGVVHRDLKPANIMLTKAGAKLMDFGLAKASALGASPSSSMTVSLPSSASQPLTSQGTLVGTFQYMSPEQIEGRDVDTRSDIFALGAVLYEMVTGKRAFEGKTQASVIAAILVSQPAAMSSLQPGLPLAVDRLVKKCLAKDPDERWQSVADLASELKWVAESPVPPAGSLTGAGPSRRAWIVSGVLMLLLLASWALMLRDSGKPASTLGTVRFSVYPPEKQEFLAEGDQSLAVSPNGRQLIFAAVDEDGKQYLWLRTVTSLTASKIAGTEGGAFPFWSPESKYIGFFAEGKLKKTPVAGGPTEVVCDVGQGAMGGSWNAQGVILIGSDGTGGNPGRPLNRCLASGSGMSPVTTLGKDEVSHRWPLFLPDDRHFLYLSFNGDPQKRMVYVASLDSGPAVHLLSTPFKVAYGARNLFYIHDRALVAQPLQLSPPRLLGDPVVAADHVSATTVPGVAGFTVSPGGTFAYLSASEPATTQLTWVSRNGNKLSEVGGPASDVSLALSEDGKEAFVGRVVGGSENPIAGEAPTNIWRINLANAGRTRITFGDRNRDENPVLSPDGVHILFASHRGGDAVVYEKEISGGSEQQLLPATENPHPIAWSPDGKYALFHVFGINGRMGLAFTALGGDDKLIPFADAPSNQTQGQFSPDGRWVAYVSDESGRQEIYVTSFPPSEGKWQVSDQGGSQPRWRGDGKELFYLAPEGVLMAVAVKLAPQFSAGKPSALFRLETLRTNVHFYGGMANYAPSRDGQRFLINRVVKGTGLSPINVVLNWTPDSPRE